ncbi:hypothetical protein BKA69DRAFT_796974 [Paraphysoderma sedebokerense]|nr:hypothetical protein BKA69DRAFT_796974 [Paraphysoderma sedebokerense]
MKLPISTCLLLLLASGALNAPAETEQNLSTGNRTSLREQKRKIEYEVGGDGKEAKIEIQFENQTIKYESEFFLKVADIPRTGAKFVMKDNNTDTKFGFRVGLFKIVEINEARGLSLKNSTNAINFFGNSTQYWSKIQTSAVGTSARKFMTTYSKPIADTGKNVSVTLDAYVTQEQVVVDNMTLHPYGLKYGLVIENFPFLYSDSHLAVVKGITYKSSIQVFLLLFIPKAQ